MAKLEYSTILGRMIRKEGVQELGIGTIRVINDLIDQGKTEEAKAMVDYFRTEMLVVHDIYAQYVQDILAFIATTFGEDQVELRGEATMLRDRHAAHYADVIAETDLMIRGPQQIEGSARMVSEWDNARAAHLWALAQGDIDLAQRLVEASFQHSIFVMRHEHSAMLRRTVQLGDDLGRPSTNILGMLSYWVDMQGDEDEPRRLAQRGIDIAPSPDDPATANCWFEFAGATAAVAPESPEAVAAFQHQAAAVANTPDLDLNWFALVNLVDASLHADPSATPALRETLRQVAESVRSPRLSTYAFQYEGHACLSQSPPAFEEALRAYERVGEFARVADDGQHNAVALRCSAMAATGLGAPDALVRCHDALDALFEIRYWQKTWQTLESTTLSLARAGRIEQAGVVLGHLDAHYPGLGLEESLGYRDQARELIDADGGHAEARTRGARMSPEELVTNALAYTSGHGDTGSTAVDGGAPVA